MLQKVFFSFCLFCSFGSTYVTGYCHNLNSSATGKTTVEVRGTFLPCHREFKGNETHEAIVGDHGDARSAKCSRRIYLSLKITNVGQIKCPDQLILVDHLFDTYTKSISRLLNPIVIKVKQEQISKVFDLKFIQLVNGEAKETIHPPNGNAKRCRRSIPCGSLMNIQKKSQRKSICCSCESHSLRHNSNCGGENMECQIQEKSSFPTAQCNVESHQQCGKQEFNVPSLCSQKIAPFSPDGDSQEMRNPKCSPHVKNLCNGDHAMARGTISDDESGSSRNTVGVSDQFSLLPVKSGGIVIYDSFGRSSDGENNGKSDGIKRINGYEGTAEYLQGNINNNMSNNRGMFSVSREVRSVDRNIDYDPIYHDGSSRVPVDTFEDEDKLPQQAMNIKEAEIYVGEGDVSNLGERDTQIDEKYISKVHSLADDIQRAPQHKPEEASRNRENEYGEIISTKPLKHGRAVKFRNRYRSLRRCNTSPDSKKVMHCMTYSDIWYEVHRLDNFTFRHVISLQAFEKNNSATGNKLWLDNTKGKTIRMGSSNIEYNETFNYRILGTEGDEILLDTGTDRLLIPRQNSGGNNHSSALYDLGNPSEFLVVKEDLIAANGSECDKAGISMEAFLSQKGRCSAAPGFCLKNQPLALWRKDKGRKKCGLMGNHTLENFGNLSKHALQVEDGRKKLSFDFYGKHISQVDIAVPVYSNYIVRKGLPSRITSIVVDSSCADHVLLTVSVGNLGLASANFTVRLGRCIPPIYSRNSINSTDSSQYFPESKSVGVSPLNQVDFTIALESEICENKLHCIAEVLNDKKMVVAARRVLIKKGERCICLWHCQCHCISTILKLLCRVMPESAVYAAGLKGTVPVFLPMKTYGYIIVFESDDFYQYLLFFMCSMMIILVLLGLCKAILGITFWHSIWIWGLPYYCGPKAIPYYREPELAEREVQFDVDGYPVHPDTKKRTVRIYNRWVELLLNIFIFLIFPLLAVVWWPICWCCSLVHRNVIGYRWVFRASKTRDGSSQNTSVTSSASSAPSEDPEGGNKSLYSDGKSSIESKRTSDSERGSGDSSSSSRGKMQEQVEEREGKGGQGGRKNGKKDDSETRSFSSRSRSQIMEIESDPLPKLSQSQGNEKLPSASNGNLSSFGSQFSIETYAGTADALEANDVDYVMKQLHRSSTEIQKSRERMSTVNGPLPSHVMENSVRGEILEDIDSSPRLESSSEDSIQGDLIGPVSGLEGGDMIRSGSNQMMPPLPPPLNRMKSLSFDADSGRSSYGLTGLLTVAPATVECSFQRHEQSPSRVTGQIGRGDKSDGADEVETVSSFTEVTTPDSLESVAQAEGKKPKGEEEEFVERLHVKHSIFRNMMHPVGGVVFPISQPYSIRGYFLKTDNGYKFIPPTPLWQYWTLDEAGIRMEPLMPPKNLFAAEFERDYSSAQNVAEAGDLSDFPLSTCINVQYQNFDSPTSSNSIRKNGQFGD